DLVKQGAGGRFRILIGAVQDEVERASPRYRRSLDVLIHGLSRLPELSKLTLDPGHVHVRQLAGKELFRISSLQRGCLPATPVLCASIFRHRRLQAKPSASISSSLAAGPHDPAA